MSASDARHLFTILLLDGVVEIGAFQSAQQIASLKTANMTSSPPRAIYYAQMIGSLLGVFVATLIYKLYKSLDRIPSDEFGIPDAHLWLVAARLIAQQGLSPRALNFALWAFVIRAFCSILRTVGSDRWWRGCVPSSMTVAVGRTHIP